MHSLTFPGIRSRHKTVKVNKHDTTNTTATVSPPQAMCGLRIMVPAVVMGDISIFYRYQRYFAISISYRIEEFEQTVSIRLTMPIY